MVLICAATPEAWFSTRLWFCCYKNVHLQHWKLTPGYISYALAFPRQKQVCQTEMHTIRTFVQKAVMEYPSILWVLSSHYVSFGGLFLYLILYYRTMLIEKRWNLEQKGCWLRLLHGSLLKASLLCFKTAQQQDQGESKFRPYENRILKCLSPKIILK